MLTNISHNNMLSQRVWKQALVRHFSNYPGLNVNHSSQLRVVSTNQWPIPYYRREYYYPRSLYPENDYNISLSGGETKRPDEANVMGTHRFLNESMWGREVLDTMQKLELKGNLNTVIDSPIRSADTYTDDLLRHIAFSFKENSRILKKHKISEIFS